MTKDPILGRVAAVVDVPMVLPDGRWNLGLWDGVIEPGSPSGRAPLLVRDACGPDWDAYRAMLVDLRDRQLMALATADVMVQCGE